MKRKRRRRNQTGTGCLVLMVLILALGIWKLMPKREALEPHDWPAAETYTEAESAIAAFCREHGLELSDYPEELVELLERNPETEDYVLHYPLEKDREVDVDLSEYDSWEGVPLFLQWDRQWGYLDYGGKPAALTACGPVSLSMAAYYLTGDEAYSPDRMIEFAARNGYYSAGNGSSWTLISEGAEKLGFDVTELPLVKSRIFKELEAGNPVICVMGPGDFTTSGHFMVLVGVEDGLLRINDPNSIANSEKLWKFEDIESQFRNLWVIKN